MDFADKTLTCADCGSPFTFTSNEQQFYAERGFTNEPKRCKDCRDKRKSGRDGHGGGRSSRQMTTVICASCGNETQVPFQPVSGRPVYCRDCYQQNRRA
jgi:CxxC-x17-CxxC domain-containing protein